MPGKYLHCLFFRSLRLPAEPPRLVLAFTAHACQRIQQANIPVGATQIKRPADSYPRSVRTKYGWEWTVNTILSLVSTTSDVQTNTSWLSTSKVL